MKSHDQLVTTGHKLNLIILKIQIKVNSESVLKMSVNSSSLSIKTSCDFVITSVRDSLLNYSIQETPYSLYLTIRKSFARSANLEHCLSNLGPQNFTEIETLKMKLKTAEEANLMLSKTMRNL